VIDKIYTTRTQVINRIC